MDVSEDIVQWTGETVAVVARHAGLKLVPITGRRSEKKPLEAVAQVTLGIVEKVWMEMLGDDFRIA